MIALIVMFIIGAVLLVVAVALLKLIVAFVVRVALAFLLSLSIGFVGAAIADHLFYNAVLVGFGLWFVSFPAALIMIWKWRGPLSDEFERPPVEKPSKPERPKLRDYDIERELGLVEAEALASAWRSAIALAPVAGLDTPRTSCARFLAAVEKSADNDPAALDTVVFVRRHVPGLVSETEAVLASADADERGELIASLVEDLHKLGRDCEEDLGQLHAAARDRLKVRRFRFRQRQTVQGDWS